jgi:hypothetical protein
VIVARAVEGQIVLDPANPGRSSLSLVVDAPNEVPK